MRDREKKRMPVKTAWKGWHKHHFYYFLPFGILISTSQIQWQATVQKHTFATDVWHGILMKSVPELFYFLFSLILSMCLVCTSHKALYLMDLCCEIHKTSWKSVRERERKSFVPSNVKWWFRESFSLRNYNVNAVYGSVVSVFWNLFITAINLFWLCAYLVCNREHA